MKVTYLMPLLAIVFYACGSGSNSNTTGAHDDAFSGDPAYQKGLELVAQNRCFQCHQVANRVNGPSYREVAEKYAGTGDTVVSSLAKKVITGGKGVWGEIAMIPHPQVSQPDAEAMIRYILLLK